MKTNTTMEAQEAVKAVENVMLNIEISSDLRRDLKIEAINQGISLRELAGHALEEFLKLPREERHARLAQWKSITFTRFRAPTCSNSEEKNVNGVCTPLKNGDLYYSPSQISILPPTIATSILHGIKVGDENLQPLPNAESRSPREGNKG